MSAIEGKNRCTQPALRGCTDTLAATPGERPAHKKTGFWSAHQKPVFRAIAEER
jgi:hypothetical protein